MEDLVKTYAAYMKEITPAELYEGLLGHGFFAEQLPPIFTSEPFMMYAKKNYLETLGNKKDRNKPDTKYDWFEWIDVDIIRDIAVPRTLSIPNPFAYHNLCYKLKEKWPTLQQVFEENTKSWKQNKVSRIHIRKQKNNKALFRMNYSNWHTDGNPDMEWLIGSEYVVREDISAFFSSIYTHALPWAIMGKEVAKEEFKKSFKLRSEAYSSWDELDAFARYMRNNETHGLLIGPHASNLLSELILTKVDSKLTKWNYYRNIDDYTCYVSNHEEAKAFISALSQQLKKYNLNLNVKKEKIEELPMGRTNSKHDELKFIGLAILPDKGYEETKDENNKKRKSLKKRYLNYEQVKGYLDRAVQLSNMDNEFSASVINYAIKVLGNTEQFELSKNAKLYFYNTSLYLASLYPYLLRILDEPVMKIYPQETIYKKKLVKKALQHAQEVNQFEEAYYGIFFDIEYDLNTFSAKDLKEYFEWCLATDDCLLKLFGWLWSSYYQQTDFVEKFKAEAENLAENGEWDRNWLFTYECLDERKLRDFYLRNPHPYKLANEWYNLKKNDISFLNLSAFVKINEK